MQLEITDRAAITFACELYAALADGYAVDAALAEARKAIFADDNEVEWGTPVLFMRVPDGRIFDVEAPVGAHRPVHRAAGHGARPETLTGLAAPIVVEPLTVAVAAQAPPVEPAPTLSSRHRAGRPPRPSSSRHGLAGARAGHRAAAGSPTPPAPPAPNSSPESQLQSPAASDLGCSSDRPSSWCSGSGSRRTRPTVRGGPRSFGSLAVSNARNFTVLSPLALVLVAGVATALAARGRRLQLAAGLLVGCGIAASAKYLGVLGRALEPEDAQDPPSASVVLFALVLAASLALILVGIRIAQLAGLRLGRTADHGGWVATALVGASALLILFACLVPFNDGRAGEVGDPELRGRSASTPSWSASRCSRSRSA